MGELLANLTGTTLLIGIAAMICVVALGAFWGVNQKETEQKKRFRQIADHREALRSAHLMKGGDGKRDAKAEERRLEALINKLKLQSMLDDDSLRARMARAGKRTRSDRMRHVISQLAFPPVFAVFFVVGYHVVWKPEAIDYTYGLVALAGVVFGFYYPGMRLDGLAQQRKKKITLAYPDGLDLMTICVESGMPMEQSMNKVSGELGPYALELVEELKITTSELSYLGDRRQALENFVNRTDLAPVRTLVSAINQSERYGTPLSQALRVLGAESRFDRMAKAEEKAASLPAKLTVPMMIFFVPVLFIVVLGPAILQMMDEFSKT